MTFNPARHHRRSIRLKGYDYAQVGAYFVTICTKNREHLFGRVEKGLIVPSEQGRIAERCWRHLSGHFWEVELDEFVLMPNHVHGIIIINHADEFNVGAKHLPGKGRAPVRANASPLQTPHGTQSGSLGAILQNFKSVSTRKINRMHHTPGVSQWQRNYHEHIIRDENSLNKIRCYIQANPLMWMHDVENPNRMERIPKQVGRTLTRHYDFTDEELDFITNYDTKYRMVQDDDNV